MQQQNQLRKTQTLPENKQLFVSNDEHINEGFIDSPFQPLQHAQQIEEFISEQYEEDFDSVSSKEEQKCQEQIKQQFINVQDLTQNYDNISPQIKQLLSKSDGLLKQQCHQLQTKINSFANEIKQKQDQSLVGSNYKHTEIKILQNQKKQNQMILSDLKQIQCQIYQSKLGKDSFSLTYLIEQNEEIMQLLIEEQLNISTLIQTFNLQIGRLRRQIKKNSDYLPLQTEQKEQLFEKYKRLKRDRDEKKEKFQFNQNKIQQLNQKMQQMKQKLAVYQSKNIIPDEKQNKLQKQIYSKYKQLTKMKENEEKKHMLSQHQIQNNCNSIARNILQLRNYNSQLTQKIDHLQQKNRIIDEDSENLMKQFQFRKNKNMQKHEIQIKKNKNKSDQQFTPSIYNKKIPQITLSRKKNYSQAKKTFQRNGSSLMKTSTQVEQDNLRYSSQNIDINSINQDFQKLGQSSTANTLKKQFKLKLPSKTPKASQKMLNISLDINSHETPKKYNKGNPIAKLSIAQRLERIQQLERKDRIYSHKLYENKKAQKNMSTFIQASTLISNQKLQLIQQIPKIKTTEVAQQIANHMDENKTILFNQQQKQPQAQQICEFSARNSEIINKQFMSPRSNHTFFKKRIIYRQKKISQEYMKILQQRGRKILELDNQSEC